jgi:5-methylcytosine-specific restriction protein A
VALGRGSGVRKEFPTRVKVEAFKRAKGACEHCTRKLLPGDVRYDHRDPDGMTGEPTLANCAVLCRSCHDLKTFSQDIPAIARAKRKEAAHLGAKPKGRGFRGWRKFNGEIVRRDP